MNPLWYFTLASWIASMGIAFVARKGIEGIATSQDSAVAQRVQRLFFLKVFFVELIPMVLVVLGFLGIEGTAGKVDGFAPTFLSVLVLVTGVILVVLESRRWMTDAALTNQMKVYLTIFVLLAILLMVPFLTISVVGSVMF